MIMDSLHRICFHGLVLNALYLTEYQQWYHIDAQGNKKQDDGNVVIDAIFELPEAHLAYEGNLPGGEVHFDDILLKSLPMVHCKVCKSTRHWTSCCNIFPMPNKYLPESAYSAQLLAQLLAP